ncbi:MAG: hypothetical protein LBE15_01485 [Burkholderiales bacterium]|jgi:chorismate-pyruvate lyase|nr:hypothetical protein [Burkholderiales bacterium]
MAACFGVYYTSHPLGEALRAHQHSARRAILRCSSSWDSSPRRRRALPGAATTALVSTSNYGF